MTAERGRRDGFLAAFYGEERFVLRACFDERGNARPAIIVLTGGAEDLFGLE